MAISIPIFTAQLEKAREATDATNIRSAYAEISADAITGETISAAKTESKITIKELRVNKLSNILRFHLPFRIMGA